MVVVTLPGQRDYRSDPLLVLGDSLFLFEHYEAAHQTFLEVAEKLENSEEYAGAVYALNQAVMTCLEMGEIERCVSQLLSAEKLAHELPSKHPEKVRNETCKAMINMHQENLDSSEIQFHKAIASMEYCCPDEAELRGDIYFHLGFLNQKSGNQLQAEESLLKSINYYHGNNDNSVLKRVRAHAILGELYISRGETNLYAEQVHLARGILESGIEAPSRLYEEIMLDYGINFIHRDLFDSAFTILDMLFVRELNKSDPAFQTLGYYSALQGHCLVETKRDSADKYLRRALNNLSRVREANHRFLSYTRRQLGKHFSNVNDHDESARQFMMAFIHAAESTASEQSLVQQNLAELYLKTQEFDKALTHINEALEIVGFREQDETFLEVDFSQRNVDDFFDPLILKGEILRQKYHHDKEPENLQEALQTYQDIENIASFYRADIYSISTENVVSDHYHRSAEGALLCLEMLLSNDPRNEYLEIAFRFMERNRYAQLFESLDRTATGEVLGVPAEVLETEADLIAIIENLERQSNQSEEFSADSLSRTRNQYRSLQNVIRSTYPTYYQIRYDSMLTLDQVQALHNDGSQTLEYFWGDTTLSILTISADSASLRSIKRSTIERDLDRMLNWLITSYLPDSFQMNFDEFSETSYRLFQMLVEPSLNDNNNQLIISADGTLSFLPFEILITDENNDGFKNATYLIKEKEIQYAHSSNLLFKSRQLSPLTRPKLLALSYSDDKAKESGLDQFMELPYSATEVDAIRRSFKQARSTALKGDFATESAFRANIGNMDVVHLAVHGIGDPDYEYNSRLIFKSDKDSLDGQLFAHELYGLPHSLRLAVLSACETGVGKNYPGEGVFSIGRAFAVTGTPSLVMSLWEVPDNSTAKIIANFYGHLSEGHRISKALQLAKIEYLESHHLGLTLPFYWAALVPMGEMSPLVKPNNEIPTSILIVSILLVGLLILWKSKKIRSVVRSNYPFKSLSSLFLWEVLHWKK